MRCYFGLCLRGGEVKAGSWLLAIPGPHLLKGAFRLHLVSRYVLIKV